MQKYHGACHCGQNKFLVNMRLDHVRRCDCSVCKKRGALNHRVPKEALTLLTPWDNLSLYQWGSKTAKDFFCAQCGILLFRRPSDPSKAELAQGALPFDGWAINVRCLENIDLSRLPTAEISIVEIAGSELIL